MSAREKSVSPGDGRTGQPRAGSGANPHENESKPISILEWIVAGIGLLLVIGVVAFLVTQATHSNGSSPMISVRSDSVLVLADGGYLVHFTAENSARTTAASVTIVGELGEGPAAETRRATLDFLPGRTTRHGALAFARDPRAGGLKLRVEGFQEP